MNLHNNNLPVWTIVFLFVNDWKLKDVFLLYEYEFANILLYWYVRILILRYGM